MRIAVNRDSWRKIDEVNPAVDQCRLNMMIMMMIFLYLDALRIWTTGAAAPFTLW